MAALVIMLFLQPKLMRTSKFLNLFALSFRICCLSSLYLTLSTLQPNKPLVLMQIYSLNQGCANAARERFTRFFEVLDKIDVTNKAFWFGLE